VSLACHPVGGAILLRDGTPDPEHTAFAVSLAADPDHTVVICDLAEEYSEQAWESVVQALAVTPGRLRLVPWREHPGGLLPVGELLGQRLARVVVAADGHPVTSAGGGLFVPPDAGTGWYRVGPGRLPRRDSRRFPKPKWTAWAPLEDMVALTPATTLRPLPSGAWLSPEGTAPARPSHGGSDHGQWLYSNVAWSHDTINVVLGQPGAPPVPAADVAKLWSMLPVKARQRVQFVPYGTSAPSRQELADALGDRVTVAAPLSGTTQWASEPAGAAATGQPATASPAVSRPPTTPAASVTGAVRQPASSPPVRPERQRLPAIRLESGPSGGGRQRVSAAPGGFTRDAATPPRVAIERPEEPATVKDEEREGKDGAAAQLAARAADAVTGYGTAPDVAPASSPSLDPAPAPVPPPDPAPAPVPPLDPAPAPLPPVSVSSPGEALAPAVTLDGVELAAPAALAPAAAPQGPGAVRVQPVPAQDASAAHLGDGLEKERQWLQQSLSREFSATASSVARVLSQNPRLRGGGEQEVVVDLVAVRLYLTEYGQRIDDNVRTGQVGSHVPFARCVNAGLRRLPSHRGAVRLRATLSDAEWSWYGSVRLFTEWAFCPALTDGTVKLPGNVDFLIWSATARRTSALAPEIPGQVLFLPGALFKVLEVRDGPRREVLLREMSARETASGEPLGLEPTPLDEMAFTGLGKANVAWLGMKQGTELPQEYAHRFGHPPGLIRNPAGSLVT
jgi:hypothetical protein